MGLARERHEQIQDMQEKEASEIQCDEDIKEIQEWFESGKLISNGRRTFALKFREKEIV